MSKTWVGLATGLAAATLLAAPATAPAAPPKPGEKSATKPAPAAPPKWATCYFEASGGVGTSLALLVLEPFPVAADKTIGSNMGGRFHQDVGVGTVVPGYAPFASFNSYDCSTYDTEGEARARFARSMNARGYAILKSVSWRPPREITGMGSGASGAKVTSSSGSKGSAPDSAATVVKSDTSLGDAGKAWDEQVKKALAAEAQKKVETAAQQAKADAKLKADYEAFFAERRRQGARQ